METLVVLLFFALIIAFGLCRGFRDRTKGENALYLVSVAVSLAVLVLRGLPGAG